MAFDSMEVVGRHQTRPSVSVSNASPRPQATASTTNKAPKNNGMEDMNP
jgi:hypothetical protein